MEGTLQVDPSAHEEVTGDPAVGISIRNLTKIYSKVLTSFYDDGGRGGGQGVQDINMFTVYS